MKNKKKFMPVQISITIGTRACATKHAKAGANCKMPKNISCRIG